MHSVSPSQPITQSINEINQPFNYAYIWSNTTDNTYIADPSASRLNSFMGSVTQQAASVVTDTNQRCYEYVEGCYSVYAFEVSIEVFSSVFWIKRKTWNWGASLLWKQYKPGKRKG